MDPSGEEEQSIYDKVVNNGFVQGTGGFFVGFGQGLWSTVKTVGNVIAHPIDTVVGIGQSVKNTAVGTYELGKDFYNAPGKTWNETTTGLGMMYDEFVDQSPYDLGKDIGFITEKVAEVIVIKKAGSNINSNPYLRIGEGYTQKGAVAKEFRVAIGSKKAWIHAHVHAGNLFTPTKWIQKFFGFKKYN